MGMQRLLDAGEEGVAIDMDDGMGESVRYFGGSVHGGYSYLRMTARTIPPMVSDCRGRIRLYRALAGSR